MVPVAPSPPKTVISRDSSGGKTISYDPDAPKEANQECIELIQEGWKIGQPANLNTLENGGVGLYKPLKTK